MVKSSYVKQAVLVEPKLILARWSAPHEGVLVYSCHVDGSVGAKMHSVFVFF